MINNRQLEHGDGQLLHDDVVKDPHERELVTHLEANVVAKERVAQS
jgi:hypothetical protein